MKENWPDLAPIWCVFVEGIVQEEEDRCGTSEKRARDGRQERRRERWRTAPCGRPPTVLWRPLTVLWEIPTVLWKTSVSCDGRYTPGRSCERWPAAWRRVPGLAV